MLTNSHSLSMHYFIYKRELFQVYCFHLRSATCSKVLLIMSNIPPVKIFHWTIHHSLVIPQCIYLELFCYCKTFRWIRSIHINLTSLQNPSQVAEHPSSLVGKLNVLILLGQKLHPKMRLSWKFNEENRMFTWKF